MEIPCENPASGPRLRPSDQMVGDDDSDEIEFEQQEKMSDHPEHEDVMEVSNMIDTLQANDGDMKFRMRMSGPLVRPFAHLSYYPCNVCLARWPPRMFEI